MAERERVILIGGGFGGLQAARGLAGQAVDVTLIDRNNYHLFQPLLYQVATAAISPADIAHPIRAVFRRAPNIRVLMAEVTGIDVAARQVTLHDDEVLAYDSLIVASGATHAYFGHDDWAAHAPGLKTIGDALALRSRFLRAFELAERTSEPARRQQLLTFVIIGAGPTGVELAGAIAEIARSVLPGEFRSIRAEDTRILLLEAGPRPLSAFPEPLSAAAREQLERLGVEVRCGQPVAEVAAGRVTVGGEPIAAECIFWAAGVAASPLGGLLGAAVDRVGRVLVTDQLALPDHPEVMVIGDLASVRDRLGQPVPGVAPAAMQMGRYAARRILARRVGHRVEPFVYRDKGSLAVIGRGAAVASLAGRQLRGPMAWLAWLGIHIWFLIDFRNRVLVMLQWAWDYLDVQRGARLITVLRPTPPPIEDEP